MSAMSWCYHGICVTQPCGTCVADGYLRCPVCRRLFMPRRSTQIYCDIPPRVCLQIAAQRRRRAREQQDAQDETDAYRARGQR